jgi:hypothetical protein
MTARRAPARGIRAFAIGLALVLAAPTVSAAEDEKWDQQQVAALAKQLASAVDGLRDSFRQSQTAGTQPTQQKVRFQVLDELRMLEMETRHLALSLEKGAGRDETAPAFRRIEEIRKDLADDARRAYIEAPTQQRIDAARGIWRQLEPYYLEEVGAP